MEIDEKRKEMFLYMSFYGRKRFRQSDDSLGGKAFLCILVLLLTIAMCSAACADLNSLDGFWIGYSQENIYMLLFDQETKTAWSFDIPKHIENEFVFTCLIQDQIYSEMIYAFDEEGTEYRIIIRDDGSTLLFGRLADSLESYAQMTKINSQTQVEILNDSLREPNMDDIEKLQQKLDESQTIIEVQSMQITELKEKLVESQAIIEAQSVQLAELQQKIAENLTEIDVPDTRMTELQQKLDESQSVIEDQSLQIIELQERLAESQAEIEALNMQIAELLQKMSIDKPETTKTEINEAETIDNETSQIHNDECMHNRTRIINYHAASCVEKGYSGDEYCDDCQTIIRQGEEIPFEDHHYENGICIQCGWLIPGLYNDGQLVFTWDQLIENGYITVYENRVKRVLSTLPGRLVVEEGFAISSEAFYKSVLDEVDLPRTYNDILRTTFYGAGISSIVFYGDIEWIGESAFADSMIKEINITGNVSFIPNSCFAGCELLERVYLPDSVNKIERSAFADCRMLGSIDLPDGLETIERSGFAGSGLKSIVIPESVTKIGDFCFGGCEVLESADLSQCSVEKLERGTFSDCPNLKSVQLPNNLVSIDSSFEYPCYIEYLVLPDSLRKFDLGNVYTYPVETLKWVVWPVGLTDASGFESAVNLEDVYYRGSEFQWNLITGKGYYRPFGSEETNIFENVTVHFNCTEEDWVWRLPKEYREENNTAEQYDGTDEYSQHKEVLDKIEKITTDDPWTLEDIKQAFIEEYGSEEEVLALSMNTFHKFTKGNVVLCYYQSDSYYLYYVRYYNEKHDNYLFEQVYTIDKEFSKNLPTYYYWVVEEDWGEVAQIFASSENMYYQYYEEHGPFNRYINATYYDDLTLCDYIVWEGWDFYIEKD